VTRRHSALVVAVVTIALWFGAATPGLAAANEAPSPPTLGVLVACAAGHLRERPAIGSCPAIVRRSSSAIVSSAARRSFGGLPRAVAALVVLGVAGFVARVGVRRPPRPILGRNGARAPPLPVS
jgi:hypothetical protein